MSKQEKPVTVRAALITWKGKGIHTVKIRVTHKGKSRYYPVTHQRGKIIMSESDFSKMQKRCPAHLMAVKDSIDTEINALWEKIARLKVFSLDALDQATEPSDLTLFKCWRACIIDLEQKERFNYALTMRASFKKFAAMLNPKKLESEVEKYVEAQNDSFTDVALEEVTSDLLEAFNENYKATLSRTSIALHLRNFRRVFNQGAKKHHRELVSPFRNFDFKTIGGKRPGKKGIVLSIENLKKFIAAPGDLVAKKYFLFSFYANGMNFSDIARLRFEKIVGDKIFYTRKKTETNETEPEELKVHITDDLRKLLVELRRPEGNGYVFPILNEKMNEEQIVGAIRNFISTTNKSLKAYCIKNGLPQFSTYTARHSWATIQKRSGASITKIADALGHSSESTTQTYLRRLDDVVYEELGSNISKALA